MKISLGSKIIEGPFGGGNDFLKNLKRYLELNGHEVVNNLKDPNIDVILLTNPLIDSETSTFNNFDIDYYIKFKNPKAIVFQRINECDERKGTMNVNSKINEFNRGVDINIFVSDWLRSVYKEYDMYHKKYVIIKGGPNEKIFNINHKKFWNGSENLKIVTHHWSSNKMKGFNIYKEIDTLIRTDNRWKNVEFTFIGNWPKEFKLINTNLLPPLHGNDLSQELQKHHIYISASQNEPSGNHHMEGALCGMPILYIESGALPEYCSSYGVSFDENTISDSLQDIKDNYQELINKIYTYPYNFSYAATKLEREFQDSLLVRDEIISLRPKVGKIKVLSNFMKSRVKLTLVMQKNSLFKALGKLKKNILGVKNASN